MITDPKIKAEIQEILRTTKTPVTEVAKAFNLKPKLIYHWNLTCRSQEVRDEMKSKTLSLARTGKKTKKRSVPLKLRVEQVPLDKPEEDKTEDKTEDKAFVAIGSTSLIKSILKDFLG